MPYRGTRIGFWRTMFLASGLVFLIGRTEASAAEGGKTPTLAELINGAKKETTLRAQWGADTLDGGPGVQKIVAAMNKKYGLNIQTSFTPGANMQGMMGKITREMAAGQPASSDVYFGNPQSMLQAMEAKPLVPMDWRALLERKMASEPGFDPIVPGNIGVAMASTLVGAMYNTNLVKGSDIPQKLEDFLNPKWKGKIASTPYAAGLREFAMPELLGKEKIIDYAKKVVQAHRRPDTLRRDGPPYQRRVSDARFCLRRPGSKRRREEGHSNRLCDHGGRHHLAHSLWRGAKEFSGP